VTAAARIAEAVAEYDGGNGEASSLAEAALRRLSWRKARGGKECSRCEETKPVSEFAADGRRPDGLAYSCRSCESLRKRLARIAARSNVL
jgi:hypothetical protein